MIVSTMNRFCVWEMPDVQIQISSNYYRLHDHEPFSFWSVPFICLVVCTHFANNKFANVPSSSEQFRGPSARNKIGNRIKSKPGDNVVSGLVWLLVLAADLPAQRQLLALQWVPVWPCARSSQVDKRQHKNLFYDPVQTKIKYLPNGNEERDLFCKTTDHLPSNSNGLLGRVRAGGRVVLVGRKGLGEKVGSTGVGSRADRQ